MIRRRTASTAFLSVALGALIVGGMIAPTTALAANESQAAVLGLLYTPGGREMAMGGAGTAGAKGVSASYYNPALLSWQTSRESNTFARSAGSTYYKILQSFGLNDMYYMYFPVMFSVPDWGQFSVNVTYLSLGKQDRTDEQGNNEGTFETYTVAIGLSYSSRIASNASAGLTIKWFYDHLADAGAVHERGKPTGQGFALDAGIAYVPMPSLTLAAALRNYGPNVQYIDANQASPTPVNFNLGAAWRAVDTEYNDITLSLDVYKPLVQASKSWYLAPILGWADEDVYKIDRITDGEGNVTEVEHRNTLREEGRQIDVRAGLEYTYAQYVSLRTGYFRDWDGERNWMTFGAGFRLPIASTAIEVDFAYVRALGDDEPNDGLQAYSIGVVF